MARELRQRQVRFNQRITTIIAMARDLSDEFGAHVAVVAFSPAGEPHAFGAPTADSVLRTYLPSAAPPPPSPSSILVPETAGEAAARVARMKRVAAEYALLAAAVKEVRAATQPSAGMQNWWEVDVDALGEEELPVFIRELQLLRAEVQGRLDAIASARPPLP